MTPQILRLSDGAAVGLLERGRGDRVLLLHGVGLCAEAWSPQIEALSRGRRVIAADLPGHGRSDPLPGAPGLREFVLWSARLCEALGAGASSVVGHSMGALIAAGLAVERPELVRRAALLCGVHRRDARARAEVMARSSDVAGGPVVDAVLDRWFGAGEPALRARVRRWLEGAPKSGYAVAYRAFAEGDAVYADRFGEIRCPLLALTADGDPNSTPAMARTMAAMAPLGRAVVIAGHRHMAPLTAADAVNAELMRWLTEEERVG